MSSNKPWPSGNPGATSFDQAQLFYGVAGGNQHRVGLNPDGSAMTEIRGKNGRFEKRNYFFPVDPSLHLSGAAPVAHPPVAAGIDPFVVLTAGDVVAKVAHAFLGGLFDGLRRNERSARIAAEHQAVAERMAREEAERKVAELGKELQAAREQAGEAQTAWIDAEHRAAAADAGLAPASVAER